MPDLNSTQSAGVPTWYLRHKEVPQGDCIAVTRGELVVGYAIRSAAGWNAYWRHESGNLMEIGCQISREQAVQLLRRDMSAPLEE